MKNTAHKPLVTVMMPVYNGADYLEEAIESVEKSTFKDFEFLLIDDGSKDDSNKILRKMARKYKNIRLYTLKQNKGLVYALNYGLKHAKGTYICRLNQDDRMLPHRITTQVSFLERNQDVVVVGSWINLIHVGKQNWTETVRYLERDDQIKSIWHILSPFSDPAVMYRREKAIQLGGYDPQFFIAEDSHMWIRMGTIGALANIPEVLTEVRFHEDATTYRQFRRLMETTFRLHRWMHNNVQQFPIHIQLFWLMQYGLGMILHPKYVFSIYRRIKMTINFFKDVQVDFKKNYLMSVIRS